VEPRAASASSCLYQVNEPKFHLMIGPILTGIGLGYLAGKAAVHALNLPYYSRRAAFGVYKKLIRQKLKSGKVLTTSDLKSYARRRKLLGEAKFRPYKFVPLAGASLGFLGGTLAGLNDNSPAFIPLDQN